MRHDEGRSQSHDEFCSDLMYGWQDEAGRFHEPVATLANGFAAHEQYHRRVVDQKVVSQTAAARQVEHADYCPHRCTGCDDCLGQLGCTCGASENASGQAPSGSEELC